MPRNVTEEGVDITTLYVRRQCCTVLPFDKWHPGLAEMILCFNITTRHSVECSNGPNNDDSWANGGGGTTPLTPPALVFLMPTLSFSSSHSMSEGLVSSVHVLLLVLLLCSQRFQSCGYKYAPPTCASRCCVAVRVWQPQQLPFLNSRSTPLYRLKL